ncbi:MAG: outer membrane beta-barrel protein [Bacteroidaceae bacterium]|jgi:hypothetical protein|nr:outer membrane beta-barrel protein [Bacteroidaceae bacterium]
MKRILLTLIASVALISAHAQFEQKKKYINASVSELNMSFNDKTDLSGNFNLAVGYFVDNNFLVKGDVGYGYADESNRFNAGLGTRYYFQRNGVFVGVGGNLSWREHGGYRGHGKWLVDVPAEVGYAFFINRHVTIEPALYYKVCLNEFKDYSEAGFKIGFGVYF